MTTSLLMTFALLLVVTFALIAWPLVTSGRSRRGHMNDAALAGLKLEDQLQFLVDAVRDLDFDFDMGKIEPDDYAQQRKMLIGRGVSTLMRLDEHRSARDEELEAMIAAARKSYS